MILRFVKNSSFVLLSQIWILVLSFIATPYIIKKIGMPRFGLLAVLLAFVGYFSFLDLGVGWALVKFLAEFKAKEDRESIQKSICTILGLLVCAGSSVAIFLIGFSDVVVRKFLNLPLELIPEAKTCLKITALTSVLNIASGVFDSALTGLQRFDILSVLRIVFNSTSILGAVLLLYHGYGLLQVVWLYLAIASLNLVTQGILLKRMLPFLSLVPKFSWSHFKMIFNFSFFTTINKLCIATIFQLDKLVVGFFLPLSHVAYYTVPFNLAQKLNLLATNVSSVMFPLVSEQLSINKVEAIKHTYHKVAKLVFLFTVIPTMVLSLFSKKILTFWLGIEFAENAFFPLVVLSLAYCFVSVSSIEAVSIEGAGKPNVTARFLGVSALINLVLNPILTYKFGIRGTSLAILLSLMILACLNIGFANLKIFKSGLKELFTKNYLPGSIMIMASLPALYYTRNLIGSLPSMIIICLSSMLVLSVMGFLVALTSGEREQVKKLIVEKWL